MSSIANLIADNALIIVSLAAVAGIVVYFKVKPDAVSGGTKKRVLLLRSGFRAIEVPVDKETSLKIDCSKVEGVTRHFVKLGRGYNTPKNQTIFLAQEGSAYTAMVKDTGEVKLSLPNTLRVVWGEDAYEKTPTTLKKAIEEAKFGITIAPDKLDVVSDGMPAISSEDVFEMDDAAMLKELAKVSRKSGKTDWLQIVAGFLGGALLAYLAQNMGWIK